MDEPISQGGKIAITAVCVLALIALVVAFTATDGDMMKNIRGINDIFFEQVETALPAASEEP